MMNIENVITATDIAEKAYEVVNDLISNHSLDMIDLAYPAHDGEQDAENVAEMMMLRMAANRLAIACNDLVDKITNAIGEGNKIEEELEKTGYRYRDNEDGTYDVCYDHAQDAFFTGVNMYHVATVKEGYFNWYINNNTGAGWAGYPKKDWTLKDAIYDQCIDEHMN